MARRRVGRVIAERVYQLQTPAGVRPVTLRIGQAVPDPTPGGDWVCPVEFRGAPRAHLPAGMRAIPGIDALQATVLAVGYAHRELVQLQRRCPGQLTWLGSADLGLPDILGLVGIRRTFRAPSKLRLVERRALNDQGRR